MDLKLECAHMQKVHRTKELAGRVKYSKHTNIRPMKIDWNLYNNLLSSKDEMVELYCIRLIKDHGAEYQYIHGLMEGPEIPQK